MNRIAQTLRLDDDKQFDRISTALIWLLCALCCGVLIWFVTLLNEMTERGEQRRLQQRTTGSLVLANEVKRNTDTPSNVGVVAANRSLQTLR